MNPSIHTARVLPARAVLFLGIVGIHVLLAYAFASGLIGITIDILRPDSLEVTFPDPPKPPAEPQQPNTMPTMLTAEATVPLPEVPNVNMEPDAATIALPVESALQSGPVAVPEPAPLPIRLVGRNVMPNTTDYYPPADVREGNEGTAEVQSCINVNGKLNGAPTIQATSGRPSLDKAAVRLARDGKYARAMRGDTPVPNCYRFRVTFTMH